MPIKCGLKEKRKELLESELQRMLPEMIKLKVEKIILFGSLAENKVHRSSDIDLIVIKKTEEKFLNRPDEFYIKLKPRCALDVLVYTPEEFNQMMQRNFFIKKAIATGRILYER